MERDPDELAVGVLYQLGIGAVELPHGTTDDGPAATPLLHEARNQKVICHEFVSRAGMAAGHDALNGHVVGKSSRVGDDDSVGKDFQQNLRTENGIVSVCNSIDNDLSKDSQENQWNVFPYQPAEVLQFP